MTTTKTTTKLEQKLDEEYKNSLRSYKETIARCKEGKAIIEQMPFEIADGTWWVFRKQDTNKWYLETWLMEKQEADDFVKRLKILGVYGIASKYRNLNNSWEYTGSFMIGDVLIIIKVDGGSKPPNCRIEETKEIKEVITYKAICEETEEEL